MKGTKEVVRVVVVLRDMAVTVKTLASVRTLEGEPDLRRRH